MGANTVKAAVLVLLLATPAAAAQICIDVPAAKRQLFLDMVAPDTAPVALRKLFRDAVIGYEVRLEAEAVRAQEEVLESQYQADVTTERQKIVDKRNLAEQGW